MFVRKIYMVKIVLLKMFRKKILDERTLSTALIASMLDCFKLVNKLRTKCFSQYLFCY